MTQGLELITIGILAFFLAYFASTLALLALSLREISWYARGQQPGRTRPEELAHSPSLSLVVPAYNEETLVVQSISAFLDLDHAPLEIVVVDDGSTDETFARLDEAFDLVPLPLGGELPLETAPIRSLHISRKAPALRVVRKENAAARTRSTPASASRGESSSP